MSKKIIQSTISSEDNSDNEIKVVPIETNKTKKSKKNVDSDTEIVEEPIVKAKKSKDLDIDEDSEPIVIPKKKKETVHVKSLAPHKAEPKISVDTNNSLDTPILKLEDVSANNFKFLPVTEVTFSTSQRYGFINYQDSKLGLLESFLLQTPLIELSGVAIFPYKVEFAQGVKEGSKSDVAKRAIIQLPLNPDIPECKKIIDILSEIDANLSKPEKLKELLGTNYKKYTYTPILVLPKDKEESVEDDRDSFKSDKKPKKGKGETEFVKHPYIKTRFPSDQEGNILVDAYLRHKKKDTDGKDVIERTELALNTIKDIEQHIPSKSKIRLQLIPNKMWANNNAMFGATNKLFGWTFQIGRIEIEPAEKKKVSIRKGAGTFL